MDSGTNSIRFSSTIPMTTILHLTDLHFGAEPAASASALAQRINTLESLRETLSGLRGSLRPDIVVVSGDIGWAGRPADYTAAAEWLRSILRVLELPPERLVLCPGNHDLDRAEAEVLERPAVAVRADRLLRVEKLSQISRPFAAFESFAQEMGVPPLRVGEGQSYLVGERHLCGLRFVVANTAWFCRDDDDKGKLFVGLPHLEVMQAAGQLLRPTEYDQAEFTVAVLHHPETWLADDETASYEGRPATYYHLARHCHLLLSGHTHGGVEGPRKIGDGGLLFVGGASYADGRYRNNVSLLRIDAAKRSVERASYEFDPRDGGWHAREATTHRIHRGGVPPPEDLKVTLLAEPRERISEYELSWDRPNRAIAEQYDVFLNYSHESFEWVEGLAHRLADECGFKIWFDPWTLIPGKYRQDGMGRGLEVSASCALCIGPQVPREWLRKEIEGALEIQARKPEFRIIPVLLPGVETEFVSSFLSLRAWADFRDGKDLEYAFHVLRQGIRGEPVGRWPLARGDDQSRSDLKKHEQAILELRNFRSLGVDEEVLREFQRKVLDRWLDERSQT